MDQELFQWICRSLTEEETKQCFEDVTKVGLQEVCAAISKTWNPSEIRYCAQSIINKSLIFNTVLIGSPDSVGHFKDKHNKMKVF